MMVMIIDTLQKCQGRLKIPQNRRFKIPQKDILVLLFLRAHVLLF